MAIQHQNYDSIQYDFYIPEQVWSDQRIQDFFHRIQAVEKSATVFSGLTGVWKGERESTRIYRVAVPTGRFDREGLRRAFQREIEELLIELGDSRETSQEAVFFTETDTHVCVSSLPSHR